MSSKFSQKMHHLNEKRHDWRESIKHRPIAFALYKVTVVTVGILVVFAGIAMLVLPGPGLLGIFAGLSILATEIPWARQTVRRIRLHVKRLYASYKRWREQKRR